MSRRTVARDLDFLRDEERAPLAYDDARHGFRLTDETYTLPPVRISRKEAFSFGLARKLLAHYEGTPLLQARASVLTHFRNTHSAASCRASTTNPYVPRQRIQTTTRPTWNAMSGS